jgi:hypothetical protein
MALQSKVARGDGKPRSDVGHAQDAHPGGGRQLEEPTMHTALAAAPLHAGNDSSDGSVGRDGGGLSGDAAPAGGHSLAGDSGGAVVGADSRLPAAVQGPGVEAGPDAAQRWAARADAEAEVAAAVRAASEMRAAESGSS